MALRFQILPAQENDIINYEMVTGNTVITVQQDSTTNYICLDEEESPEALVKSLRRAIEKAGGKKKAQENLLLGYHVENDELGFPIEALVAGNYERYVDAVKMLLYSQNQALYAGEVSNICFDKKRIILTFPLLLIIKLLDMQDILMPYLNQIVIPKLLIEFVAQLARNSTEQQVISLGNLIDQVDGTMVLIPFDDTVVELYTDIYELCFKLSKTNYIYIPIIAENMDSLKELWKNMLNGERKGMHYEEVIRNF